MKIKLFYKLSIIFGLIINTLSFSVPVDAASFSLATSTSQVAPGANFTVSVGGDCIGRINLKASGGTISQSAVWVEENRQTVTVTAGNSGTVTITATPEAGLSDSDGNEYKPGTRSVSVKIVAPSQPAQTKPNTNTGSSTNTSKPQSTSKPQTTIKPVTTQTNTTKPEESEQPQESEVSESVENPNRSESDQQETAIVPEESPTAPCQTINGNKLVWILVAILATLFAITLAVLIYFIIKCQKLSKVKNVKKNSKK